MRADGPGWGRGGEGEGGGGRGMVGRRVGSRSAPGERSYCGRSLFRRE